MGNRAMITDEKKKIGIYLHWNGGRDSVEAFLKYCKKRGFRSPDKDGYGWARLCQVIGNFYGGDLSIGINILSGLACKFCQNGVYVIKNWEIVDRLYFEGPEQQVHALEEMLKDIDKAQPIEDRLFKKEDGEPEKPNDVEFCEDVEEMENEK